MRFSKLMLSVCALITLNGCAYFIPPEQNAPRHNTVLGGPRRPQMNLVSGPLSSLTRAPETNNFATAAPVEPVTAAAQQAPQAFSAPAVASAPEPQFQQPQQITVAPRVTPVAESARTTVLGVPMPSISRTYDSIVGPSTTPSLPAVDPVVKAQAERELAASAPRTIPPENQQFQVAGNYPPLDSVPPRPALTGADSSKSRLSATQSDLERERIQAQQSKETLARDAAAEPSLLAPAAPTQAAPSVASPTTPSLPAAVLPADTRSSIGNGAAATPSPTPSIVANTTAAPRIVLPTTPIITQPLVPTGPSFAPPAPLNMASLNAPQRQPVQPVATQNAASPSQPATAAAITPQRQPIMLRPPVPYEAAPVVIPAATPSPSRGGITVRPGDFDPLAGA